MTVAGITVLLVDDHAVVREGYRRLLDTVAGITVIGEANDGLEAYRLFCALAPQVVVLDINLPGMSGLQTMRRMLAFAPTAKILVFSMFDEAMYIRKALEDGACGYLTKASAPAGLVNAVQVVAAGGRFISPDASLRLALPAVSAEQQALTSLTVREFEILRLLAQGKILNDIAALLFLTQKTVANHQSMIKQKLGCENSAQLVLIAMRAGLLPDAVLPAVTG